MKVVASCSNCDIYCRNGGYCKLPNGDYVEIPYPRELYCDRHIMCLGMINWAALNSIELEASVVMLTPAGMIPDIKTVSRYDV